MYWTHGKPLSNQSVKRFFFFSKRKKEKNWTHRSSLKSLSVFLGLFAWPNTSHYNLINDFFYFFRMHSTAYFLFADREENKVRWSWSWSWERWWPSQLASHQHQQQQQLQCRWRSAVVGQCVSPSCHSLRFSQSKSRISKTLSLVSSPRGLIDFLYLYVNSLTLP